MKSIRALDVWESAVGQVWSPGLGNRAFHRGTFYHQTLNRRAICTSQAYTGSGSLNRESFHRPFSCNTLGRKRLSLHQNPPCKSLTAAKDFNDAKGRARYSTKTIADPTIHDLFEPKTGTWQYVVADPSTSTAVIIDPVLDYDPATQAITTGSADSLLALVKKKNYRVGKILETHAHADHLTAASYIQDQLAQRQGHRPPICVGKRIGQVQKMFGQRYGIPSEEYEGVFDRLFDDDEVFRVGNLEATAIHLPGHTPDHLGYRIGDNVFCGDSIFHIDIGTARCDFPGGSARNLYRSGRKLLDLPDHVKIWTGHDYPPKGRSEPKPWMSVRDHKEQNKHLTSSITEEEFVVLREQRDMQLAQPRLLHQSLQINIRAGRLPKATEAGHRMLHLPLKLQGLNW